MEFPQLARLLGVLRRLRGPEGCAWDQEQDLRSAAHYLSDEVFEYVAATERDDLEATRDELADLFYMVAYNWLILSERLPTEFDELPGLGADKLVRRKPHVFGDDPEFEGMSHEEIWRRVKAREKGEDEVPTLLKDLHAAASPLRQAHLHGSQAARADFDWSGPEPVLAKLDEELAELHEAMANRDPDHVEEEVGDLLFAVVQLARKLDVDPDAALRRTNAKFAERFRAIEARHDHDPERMKALGLEGLWREWNAVKKIERGED